MRNTFGADSDDTHLALFRRLAAVDLLVLDDLGAERQTEWVLEQLYSLVNERWQDQRSIVVTNNTPDPYRDATLGTLRAEIAELRRRRRGGAGGEEQAIVARLGESPVSSRTAEAVERRRSAHLAAAAGRLPNRQPPDRDL